MNLTKRSILLKQELGFDYLLYQATQNEALEIEALCRLEAKENEYYPFIEKVQLCAHISEISEGDIKSYVPLYYEWVERSLTSNRTTEYKEYICYANKNRNPLKFSCNVRIHEDRVSSFKCALQCLNAEYFYILKEPVIYPSFTQEKLSEVIDDIIYTKPTQDEPTNNNNNTEVCP